MKTLTLPSEARARLARQLAESSGVVVQVGDRTAAPST